MYPEKIDIWRRGQALTAARLNKTVNAVNYLLSLSAEQDADQTNGGATQINVAPPGGYIPPEPSFANPPADDITALAQPFKFIGDAEVKMQPSPVYGAAPHLPELGDDITPYYINITTDTFGKILSVTPSESAASYYFWDGNTTNGNLSFLTGALGVNEYGETYSIDGNPLTLPVIPVNAAASDTTAFSLVVGLKDNSALIKALKTDDSVFLSDEGNAIRLSIKKDGEIPGTINSITYDLTASAPGVSNSAITINGAQSGAPGVIAGINVEFYDPSEPSYETPPQSKIDKGIITLYIPRSTTNNDMSIGYDLTASEPRVENGQILINGASYAPADPSVTPAAGVISSVTSSYFNPSEHSDNPPQPTIINSVLNIPLPNATTGIDTIINTTDSDGSTAAPGVNGWVQTMYVYGVWSGQMNFYEYLRQLMRIHNGELQIVNQRSTDASTWYPA